MPSSYFVKLFTELLDDIKFIELPDWAKWRFVQFILVAKENNRDGLLPSIPKLAWRLRLEKSQVEEGLGALEGIGVVATTPDGYLIVNFAKRQAPSSSTERVRQYRKRLQMKQCNVSRNAIEEEEEEEVEEEVEEKKIDYGYFPTSPKEAVAHSDIQLFQEVSNRIPAIKQYRCVIETIQLLRKRFSDEQELVVYLKPFWLSWQSRKTRTNGRSYDLSNLAWLTEWAINNHIPPEYDPVQKSDDWKEKYQPG